MGLMSMARVVRRTAAIACVLAVFAARVQAQNLTSAGIDGVVSDDSGAALPGVAVTASSPALQVQQVSTVTVSLSVPTFSVVLMRAEKPAVSSRPCRTSGSKPASSNLSA